MVKFLDLKKQYFSIKSEINNAINSVISDSAFVGGKHVKMFEEKFAEYNGVKYCVGVGNGTDAIEIALEALALPKGSEVIVPANSFIASSEAVSRAGLKV
ncbi:MAG: DegT/DnrJ/EryC1/StrS family aminotransferase, partial [Candidatus Kapaibacterium sp.]